MRANTFAYDFLQSKDINELLNIFTPYAPCTLRPCVHQSVISPGWCIFRNQAMKVRRHLLKSLAFSLFFLFFSGSLW